MFTSSTSQIDVINGKGHGKPHAPEKGRELTESGSGLFFGFRKDPLWGPLKGGTILYASNSRNEKVEIGKCIPAVLLISYGINSTMQ